MDLAAASVYWQLIYHLKKNIDGSRDTGPFCVLAEGKLSFSAGFGKKVNATKSAWQKCEGCGAKKNH